MANTHWILLEHLWTGLANVALISTGAVATTTRVGSAEAHHTRVQTNKSRVQFLGGGLKPKLQNPKIQPPKIQDPESKTPDSEIETPKSKQQKSKIQNPNQNSKIQTTKSKIQNPKSKLQTHKIQDPESKIKTPNEGWRNICHISHIFPPLARVASKFSTGAGKIWKSLQIYIIYIYIDILFHWF